MSLELHSTEVSSIDSLWNAWSTASESELEATFLVHNPKTQKIGPLDYTHVLNVIKYLRSQGLQEIPQVPKLNILAGGLRFTLVGEGVIQAYCKDNTLKGKPFTVMIKERKLSSSGTSEIDLKEYGVRIKMRREIPLNKDDSRIMDAIGKWQSLPKSFRYMKRFSFRSAHHKGIQYDISFLRESRKNPRGTYIQATTFQEAQITKQPTHYEVEVEVLHEESVAQKSFLFGIATVLRGLQKSYVLVRETVKQQVLQWMFTKTNAIRGGFPGTQPVTLRKEHIGTDIEKDTPNLRSGDYNVTDKADGLRCLLVVAQTGKLYLVDRNLNVYGSDRRLDPEQTKEWAGMVLDGEWVTQNAENAPMSKYYAFDIFNGRRGEDVSVHPFLVRSSSVVSRLAVLQEAVAVLGTAGFLVKNISTQHSLAVFAKTFQYPEDPTNPMGIFKEAASVLKRLRTSPPYHTDGLIFTPNSEPLPKNMGTWNRQFKWKPAIMNSVDFLVSIEKERDTQGKPTNVELISTKIQEDTQQIVRHKTLRLFVGSSTDPVLMDPRDTILQKKAIPSSLDKSGVYRPVEFSPEPPDSMASVCYVAIPSNSVQGVESLEDTIVCEETNDPIQDRTIVEMVYNPHKPAGWRWTPMRVRWDKTELFARGQIGGTMNNELVANDTWSSIHDPITEEMITTGNLSEPVLAEDAYAQATVYYKRKAPHRDLYKIRGLQEFHNSYIKDNLLLGKVLSKGSAMLDMSVGQAGDIHKWVHARVGWVLGCDVAYSGLTEAYSRYLKKKISRRGDIPPMVFVQADSGLRYADGSAGLTPVDRGILRTLWGEHDPSAPPAVLDLRGRAAGGFDVASLMFSLHYFFKDAATLNGLLRNLSETIKVNGYLVGCCFDGQTVTSLLRNLSMGEKQRGTEGDVDIWSITKKYEDTDGLLPADETGLGREIDVNFISIGETYTEYLVSWDYFKARMAEIGMELLNEEELRALDATHSTNMFSNSLDMATLAGRTFPMSSVVKAFSSLNRWFIFKRKNTGTAPTLSVPTETAVVDKNPEAEEYANRTEAENTENTEKTETTGDQETKEGQENQETKEGQENQELTEEEPLMEADGPIYSFYHKSVAKDDLKLRDKNWRRYISTFAPFEYRDTHNPSIVYNSLEAALGSAKYQLASDRPELGPQIFSNTGNIHQKYAQERLNKPDEENYDKEGAEMRDEQKNMRKTGAKFQPDAWKTNYTRVLAEFVRQRYERDAHFKEILDTIAKQKARLVYAPPGTLTELSGSVKSEASIEGENGLGRAYMAQVGLTY